MSIGLMNLYGLLFLLLNGTVVIGSFLYWGAAKL